MNRPTYFHISNSRVNKLAKWNKFSFSSIEVNKPLPAPVYSALQVIDKLKSKLSLLPQTRCLTTFRIKSSIISTDSNIADYITRKAINV